MSTLLIYNQTINSPLNAADASSIHPVIMLLGGLELPAPGFPVAVVVGAGSAGGLGSVRAGVLVVPTSPWILGC